MKKAARKKKESFFVTESTLQEDAKDSQVEQDVTTETVKTPSKKFYRKRSVHVGAFIILFIVISSILGYLQLQKLKDSPSEAGKLSNQEVKNLVKELGDKMVLPENETPTIATVTDISKLEGQPFFRNAKNGDKVIIYGSTKEAILYRPSIHKIIAVSPINENAATAGVPSPATSGSVTPGSITTLTSSPTEAPKLKVVILNSTKTVGLAKKGAALLDSEKVTVSTANASGEYEKTTVSAVGKDKKITDSELKSLVSGFTKVQPTVSALPTGETVPTGVDVVIILGTDFSENY